MTDYVWRDATYESVIKKQITRQIVSIILSLKKELKFEKEWFTIAEIYDKGKKEIPDFPKSPVTILRALKSMSLPDVGILEEKKIRRGCKNQYKFVRSPFIFEELMAENEINALKDISKKCLLDEKKWGTNECNYNRIIGDESLTIYGFPGYNFNKYEKEFNEIKSKMKKDMEDLYKLAARIRLDIFYEKIYGLFNKPWGWKKFCELYNRHVNRNENFFEIIKDPEVLKVFFKVGHPSEGDVSPLDVELCGVFLYCLIFEQLHKWFDLQKSPIGVKRNLELAEIFKDFYPSKDKDEILRMLQKHEINSKLSEELKGLVDFYDHLSPSHLIAVIRGGSEDARELSSSVHCR